jgi:hypothetical protein
MVLAFGAVLVYRNISAIMRKPILNASRNNGKDNMKKMGTNTAKQPRKEAVNYVSLFCVLMEEIILNVPVVEMRMWSSLR